jgi:transposase
VALTSIPERVAAVDVVKDTGMVCTRTPQPSRPGSQRVTVWTMKARMGAVRALGRQLKRDGIEIVTLESASVLADLGAGGVRAGGAAGQRGLGQEPARAAQDKLDAMWLARLTEMGLLRASFVPLEAIRDLRDYTPGPDPAHLRADRCWQRLEKLLEGADHSDVITRPADAAYADSLKVTFSGGRAG